MLFLLLPWASYTLLYRFRFRDPVTGRWMKARYKATREEISRRYTEAEIVGPAEIRHPVGGGFTPWM